LRFAAFFLAGLRLAAFFFGAAFFFFAAFFFGAAFFAAFFLGAAFRFAFFFGAAAGADGVDIVIMSAIICISPV
jgi:hypothetical protein